MSGDEATNQDDGATGTKWPIVLAWLFVGAGLVLFVHGLVSQWPIEEPNEFGDYVGGAVGSIWALAGLLFIYAAFRGQMAQLRLQQKELRETRKEMKGQREQMEVQNRQVARQNFESTFFHLLRLHHAIVADVDLRGVPDSAEAAYFPARTDGKPDPEALQGRDAFRELFSRYRWHYDRIERQVVDRRGDEQGIQVAYSASGERCGAEKVRLTDEDYAHIIAKGYSDFYAWQQGEVGHYFRNLYHIVKYVDMADLDDDEYRANMASLVRAQLSSYELILLFYNCLSGYGGKFKLLAEKYALFEQLPWLQVIDERHKGLYRSEAFGDDAEGFSPPDRSGKHL